MSEDFGPNIISLTGEDGDSLDLEYIDELEWNGTVYKAFFPVEYEGEELDEAEYGLVIMRAELVNGEEMLAPVIDEAEYDELYEKFMEQIFEDEGD